MLVARLLVILAPTHFLLDPSMLNQFPKSLHGIVDRLVLTQTQLDHKLLLLQGQNQKNRTPTPMKHSKSFARSNHVLPNSKFRDAKTHNPLPINGLPGWLV